MVFSSVENSLRLSANEAVERPDETASTLQERSPKAEAVVQVAELLKEPSKAAWNLGRRLGSPY